MHQSLLILCRQTISCLIYHLSNSPLYLINIFVKYSNLKQNNPKCLQFIFSFSQRLFMLNYSTSEFECITLFLYIFERSIFHICNLYSPYHNDALYSKFGWNRPGGFSEKVQNVKRLQRDRQTNDGQYVNIKAH